MKIWIINQYAGSPEHGMEFRHYYLAKHLIGLGHNVSVISGSYSHLFAKPPTCLSAVTHDNVAGVPYIWLKLPRYAKSVSVGRIWNMLVFRYRLAALLKSMREVPDAIILSSPSLFPVPTVLRFSQYHGVRTIFEVRDLWPQSLISVAKAARWNPLIAYMSRLERQAYQQFDLIVSVLPDAQAHIIGAGALAEKINVIPNGVEVDPQAQSESLPAIFDRVPRDKFVVGYLGSIGAANNLRPLLLAAKQLENDARFFFVIVGTGAELEPLQQEFASLPQVLFTNSVPKKLVQSVLQLFSVCYIGWKRDSLYDAGTSPNKIFEYMLSHKPILHSGDFTTDLVRQTGAGINVAADEPTAIADGIRNMASLSGDQLRAMGQAGFAYVTRNHSYASLAQKYSDLL